MSSVRRLASLTKFTSSTQFTNPLCKLHSSSVNYNQLSANEVATALRPFFFAVHPDRFSLHPKERAINENSLKFLNQHLESLIAANQRLSNNNGVKVAFYVRKKDVRETSNTIKDENGTGLNLVQINLSSKDDLHSSVERILNCCKLSTEYLKKLNKSRDRELRTPNKENSNLRGYKGKQDAFWMRDVFRKYAENSNSFYDNLDVEEIIVKKPMDTLLKWLKENSQLAEERELITKAVREEINRVKKELLIELDLVDIVWDSSWSISHFRGSLLSLRTLFRENPKQLVNSVRGRKIILSSMTTGMSYDGHVVLSTEDVRQNWLRLIRTIGDHDELVKRVPRLEQDLSKSLGGMAIKHRKFKPSILIANYVQQLTKLEKTIKEFRRLDKNLDCDWSQFKLVVECDAGPLMLSPTGQFIAPASCPAKLLINFIDDNLVEAKFRLLRYSRSKIIESNYVNRCLAELDLESLDKDDNVTPDLMIDCCDQLLRHQIVIKELLKGKRIKIGKYYSVNESGEICIPFNWKLD